MNAFANFNSFMQQHAIISRRMALREKLLLQTDAVLARKGYSRELIETGLSAWPWQVAADASASDAGADAHAPQTQSSARSSDCIRDAARALNRYNKTSPVNDTSLSIGSGSGACDITTGDDNRFAA